MGSVPEKHSSLWSIPLCNVKEVASHSSLEDVALRPIELSNFVSVSEKA